MLNINLNIVPMKSDKKDYPYDYRHTGLGIVFMLEDLTTI